MPNLIPLSSIIITDRIRGDDPKVAELAESMKRYGLLQPVLLDHENRLMAGGRRCAAAALLGWTEIPACVRETLSEAEKTEIEFEENDQREQWTWQDRVKIIAKIHRQRLREAALKGKHWTIDETAELTGQSTGFVSQSRTFETLVDLPEYKDCNSLADAARLRLQKIETEALAEQARRLKQRFENNLLNQLSLPGTEDEDQEPSSPFSPAPVASVVSEPSAAPSPETTGAAITVDISHTLFHGHNIDVIANWPDGCVDHIITDPPYGIDMDNLQQSTTALRDVSSVAETHDVDDNLKLFTEMFPPFYRILKDKGFFVLWCDVMNFRLLHDHAIKAGFKVQRWPLVWNKTGLCGNQAPFYNWTKDFEIAMVCRKPCATLAKPCLSSVNKWPAACEDHDFNPFAKPARIWEWLIEPIVIPGQRVLDPFAGCGSSLWPLLNMGCSVVAIETLDNQYNKLLEKYQEYWKQRHAPAEINFV